MSKRKENQRVADKVYKENMTKKGFSCHKVWMPSKASLIVKEILSRIRALYSNDEKDMIRKLTYILDILRCDDKVKKTID